MSVITPKTEAHFNVPPNDPYVIQDHICDLIDSADVGSTISFAIYEYGRTEVSDALKRAVDRGVLVHLIADMESLKYPQYRQSLADLNGGSLLTPKNANIKNDNWALTNYNGGVGDNINHDKFFLFSSVQGHKKVWVQGSANMTNTKSWNNAVTVIGSPTIYDGYLTRFNALRTAATSGKHHKAPFTTVGDSLYKAYFYPEPPKSNTLLNILNNVTGGKGTFIDIACYLFLLPEVANALKRLAKRGVRVRLAYTDAATHSESTAKIIRDIPGSTVQRFENRTSYSLPYNYLHSKYMIIDGEYLGKKNSKIVWTGSLNFTDNALHHNDESVVRFYGPGTLWDAYGNDFANLIQNGQYGKYTIGVSDLIGGSDGSVSPTESAQELDASEDAGISETTAMSSYVDPGLLP